ncbi:MAG: glycerol kinase, partial [Gaiellales bacterium]|nr:glycerol kinase [Gaiellales bacterium]
MTVLIGIDQGTSGTRTVAFDASLEPLAEAYRLAAVHHPQPGWIEKGAEETVGTVRESLDEVVRAVGGPDAVSAVGLDNEGETVVAWHAETLEPLAPAVVWGCRRSQPVVDRLEQSGAGEEILELSGLPLDPYFSATKIRWLVENVPAVAKCAGERTLRIGTLDAFLTARLGEGARTEPSTAGRTQLQEPARPGEWSPRLLQLHGIEPEWLPPIGPSFGSDLGPFAGLRLGSLLVDQTASLAGHGGFRPPATKATYGSGIFLLQQRGTEIPADPAGLIPIVAWDGAGSVSYALDGGVFSAGTVITWLRDGAGLIADAAETEQLALSVPDTAGVHFLPALAGLGAPRWRSEARASFGGITAGTTRAHLVRAALDSLCFRVRDIVDRLADRPQVLRVDGGLTANRYLLQRQADVLGIPIEGARPPETTALGAAATAGVTAGVIDPADLE